MQRGGQGTYFLNLQDITRNDLGGLNLLEGAVTEDNSLESESFLQFVDDGTGLVFLDETNTGVEQQESANDTEIDPVLETGSQNSSSLNENTNIPVSARNQQKQNERMVCETIGTPKSGH